MSRDQFACKDEHEESEKFWKWCEEKMGREEAIGRTVNLRFVDDSKDPVEHPSHYTFGKFEAIDVIEDWGLGFHLGNVVKYIARAGKKGSMLEDLKKARWYLDRLIKGMEK